MAQLKYIGFKPRKWQKDVIQKVISLDSKGKTIVVKSRRQSGKSMMSENLLLYFAINKRKSVSALLSVTLAQSRKVFKELVSAIEASGIIKKKNEQTLELSLINGSEILFKSSEQGTNSLRGYTINGILILDEASFLSEDILQAVLPWTNVHRPPILVVSTPKFKNCFFYRFFMLGKDKDNKNYISIDWNDYDLSEFLSEERLNEFKSIMPSAQFKSEYLGEFLDDDAMVFTGFKDCIKDTKGYQKLYAGIDWGSGTGGDYTSISILNEKCEQVMFYNFNDKSTTQQIDYIVSILKPLKARLGLVLCESNSIGTPLSQLLMEKLPNYNIEMVATTNKSKCDMVSDLQVAFENKDISILPIDKQTNELASYALEYNAKTKTVTYNAPLGLNDDTCIALMLSLKAYKTKNKRGVYNLF